MANYQDKKVPIFPGINDIPKAPDSLEGGNISHFYDLYNGVIDDIELDVTNNASLANSALSQISTLYNDVYNYYYYYLVPLRQYTIFQSHTTTFDLGTHTLNAGDTAIGTIPANGEIYRIIADGAIASPNNIIFKLNSIPISFLKFAFFASGAIWWFYDIADGFANPYNLNTVEVTEGETLNVAASGTETDINFRIEMNVYATPASQLQPSTSQDYVFTGISSADNGQETVGTVGTIPVTGKLTAIIINDTNDFYGIYFSVNGGQSVLTFENYETVAEGYRWTIADDDSQDVVQGQTLTFTSILPETDRTITLQITS